MKPAPPIATSLPDGRVMITGRAQMTIPQGGTHVREAEVHIIPPIKDDPIVTATVVASETAAIFGIYSVKVNDQAGQTQLAFTATNVEKFGKSDDIFFCSYIVVGEPKLPRSNQPR